ncbi:glutathione synthase [Solemya velum gill symbiont]|uniref:glutathione synthase n=1 Tax=Solemya velum gill symbiont TaxID=2340 RepID=UPI0009972181|nr:glutathione synthase [Solemya velum gill symbiont]OOZ45098.1 glutathione synthase [Solemya velum gill symbiont]OOZ50360.1 glutathione synthase [Solemya velum gill symbiont]OOZ52736.1 glutathione synthase [Solemya velum gill symbiont]OOZ55944.1 glutathione synthase [Solemya velum gill symbiont]
MTQLSVGILMDPIESIKRYKDSSFAMLLEAQRRGHKIWYMEASDLSLVNGRAWARQRSLSVTDSDNEWFSFGEGRHVPLSQCDTILMRKDPPFDIGYITLTWFLDQAESEGTLVVNPPAALRNFNEKLAISHFPQFCTPALVSGNSDELKSFLETHGEIVVKPIDTMGGESIFKLQHGDLNTNVILETVTNRGSRVIMAQGFIPEISAGDKRILIVDGKPAPYALARIPSEDEFRGNLAAGGTGAGQPLSERDLEIASTVGEFLREQGILFAGIDVIGDYLTEINITSPTCIRELDAQFDLNISADLFDAIEERCAGAS